MTIIDPSYKQVKPHQNINRHTRISPLTFGAFTVLLIIIFTPIILTMIKAGNDYPMHIWWAWYWDKTGLVPSPLPHFLYQVLVIASEHIIPGGSYDVAAAFVGIVCYVGVGILLFTLIYPLYSAGSGRFRAFATVLTSLTLLLAGPINLFTWTNHNLLNGYILANAYHNPTIVLLKPFALVLFLYGLRVFSPTPVSRSSIITCVAITALGTIAKPNYIIAYIPALALLVGLAFLRKRPINWALLSIGIFLPAGEILLWQLNYVRGTSLSGFIIAPFQVMALFSPNNLLPKFILSILFPLFVTVSYWRSARTDNGLWLAWISFAVGSFYTYFLSEKQNYASGNFTWSSQITLFILFVATLMFLIRQNKDFISQRHIDLKLGISSVLLLMHLLGGIALYLANSNVNWQTWL